MRGVVATIGGSPIDFHNAVVPLELAESDVGDAVAASVAALDRRGVPGTWHVLPEPTLGLPAALIDAGFMETEGDVGMALPLDRLLEPPAPAGVTIHRLGRDGLDDWTRVLAASFGEVPVEGEWAGRMLGAIAFEPSSPWSLWVARGAGGEVLATALEHRVGDVAGIWFVLTEPSARRRGIGGALTAASLRAARDDGARLAVLGASAAGAAVYARLGFSQVGRIRLFERPARAAPTPADTVPAAR